MNMNYNNGSPLTCLNLHHGLTLLNSPL